MLHVRLGLLQNLKIFCMWHGLPPRHSVQKKSANKIDADVDIGKYTNTVPWERASPLHLVHHICMWQQTFLASTKSQFIFLKHLRTDMDGAFHPSNTMCIFHCLSFVNQTAIVCNCIKLIYIHAIIMYQLSCYYW